MTESLVALFTTVIQKLESANIEYMVVGSVASMVYGEPRLTQDMDVVVNLSAEQVRLFPALFPRDEYYLPPQEILAQEALNRRPFNLLHAASGLKIDFIVRRATPHGMAEFARRRVASFLPGASVFVAAPEDVILKKLEYFVEGGSHKHLTDIRGILAHTEVDRAYLEKWVEALHLEGPWARAQALG